MPGLYPNPLRINLRYSDKHSLHHLVYEGRRGEGYFVRCSGFGSVRPDHQPRVPVNCLRCTALSW